ncbi:MAG: ATP-binding protein [Chitinophagales bacterium]
MSAIITPIDTAGQVNELLASFIARKQQRDVTALPLGLKAHEIAQSLGNRELIAATGFELAHFYIDISTELDKAVKCLSHLVALFDARTEAEARCKYLLRLALAYDYKSDMVLAKTYYDETIQLLEGQKELTAEGTLTLARALFNQSILYTELEFESLSTAYLSRAMELFKRCDYRGGIARGFISFGVIDWRKKNYQSAIGHYENAAAIAEEDHDIQPLCIALGNIAVVKSEIGDKEEAIASIEKALNRIQEQNNNHFHLSIFELAGKVFQNLHDFQRSDFYFSQAAALYDSLGKTTDNYNLFQLWSKTLLGLNKPEEAYLKLDRAFQIREVTLRQNKQATLNDTRLQLQVNESKKEQDLLRRKNEEIRQYARKLEMTNSELNQFAYVASHDLKEPLRMVTNYAQLLKRSMRDLTDDQKNYLHYLNDGAMRMMTIINHLLELSRIGSRSELNEVPVQAVVADVRSALRSEFSNKNVVFEIGAMPVVKADRLHLHQLFLNLAGNAVKYNRSEQPVIRISATENEHAYHFEVADNGIGIEQAYRERVFVIFQRLHKRHEYDGTGIGLAICKKIVETMNGNIWIEDCDLGGTKFCFTIPKITSEV